MGILSGIGLSGVKKAHFKIDGDEYSVMFNPDSISMSMSYGVQTERGTGEGVEGTVQAIGPVKQDVSMKLFFDLSAVNKIYESGLSGKIAVAAQKKLIRATNFSNEGAFSIEADDYSMSQKVDLGDKKGLSSYYALEQAVKDMKKVKFIWGNIKHEGFLHGFNSRMTCFASDGRLLRAEVDVTIQSELGGDSKKSGGFF